MKGKYSKIVIPTIYLAVIFVMIMTVVTLLTGISRFLNEDIEYKYTIKNNFGGTTSPVNKVTNDSIIKPFLSQEVQIGKYFYDYKSDNTKQEDALIVYENTYIQNSGIDYVSENVFDVVSILDGEVMEVEQSDIYGNIVTIKHNDNLITVYSSLNDILVNVGYKTSQGEIIATSNKSVLNDYNTTLHFEVYYKGEVIDPESLYTLSIEDFR